MLYQYIIITLLFTQLSRKLPFVFDIHFNILLFMSVLSDASSNSGYCIEPVIFRILSWVSLAHSPPGQSVEYSPQSCCICPTTHTHSLRPRLVT